MKIDVDSGKLRPSVVGLLALCLFFGQPAVSPVFATYACDSADATRAYHDPCPVAEGMLEIALPIPLGLSLRFSAVHVPGDRFWHDDARDVRMGNPNAPIYEGSRNVSVAGSFPTADQTGWLILLGKYEVTVAQYIAVMGEGDASLGARILLDRSRQHADGPVLEEFEPLGRGLSSQRAQLTLASPLRGLSFYDYRDFIRRLTGWCFADAACLAALPKLDGYPAQFRLPSEIEWEYAARGGIDLANDPPFNWTQPLPFKRVEAQEFSRIAPYSERRASVVGRFRTVNGLYDLFGNVRELTEDRFTAEPGQGRMGGFTLRGGGFRDTEATLHAGRRQEFAVYRQVESSDPAAPPQMRLTRPRDVGIRLALGTPVAATEGFQARIAQEYETYRRTSRFDSGVARNSAPDLTQAAQRTASLRQISEALRRGDDPSVQADFLEAESRSIELTLNDVARKITVELVQSAIVHVAEAGRTLEQIAHAEDFLQRNPVKQGESARQAQSRERALLRVQTKSTDYDKASDSYVAKLFEISDYRPFVEEALLSVQRLNFETRYDRLAVPVVQKHLGMLLAGEQDVDLFRSDLRQSFVD